MEGNHPIKTPKQASNPPQTLPSFFGINSKPIESFSHTLTLILEDGGWKWNEFPRF